MLNFVKSLISLFCQFPNINSCQYLSSLAKQGISHYSIKCYLLEVRHLQITHSLPDPMFSNMTKLEAVVKEIKSQQIKNQGECRVRLPITPRILYGLRSIWEQKSGDYDSIMLWAACCVYFFWFMRAGELTVPSQSGSLHEL